MRRILVTCLAVLSLSAPGRADEVKAKREDPAPMELAAYRPVQGVSGAINSVGSDTMNNLMTLWGEEFKKFYPGVTLAVDGKGSSTAPPAMIEGTATFGPMSRDWKSKEVDGFVKKFGHEPIRLRTSIDMLAIYVHRDNPIASLTLAQVDAIFSSTRKGGAQKDLRTWGDVGLTGEWKDRPMALYGRNSASGTYGYFKENALFGGDFKDTVKEQPGSSAVVASVAKDLGGIGYSGIGYITADVRAVPLGNDASEIVEATPENAYSGRYPLARFLFLSVNYAPNRALEPLRAEFIRLLYSAEGQRAVAKDGYFPVPPALAAAELRKVGLAQAVTR